MIYRDEIDGLRAISVFGVILYHFKILGVTGGFFGVDVFFVISGYLISSLLFEEIDRSGTVSFSGFYLRRTRRILPALLFFCLASYLLHALFVGRLQSPFPHFGGSLLATLFSVSNIYFWQHAGYFAIDSWAEPLLHTWSLGVEEQFYLLIPILLYVISRRRVGLKDGREWVVFITLAVLSFSLCRWCSSLGGDFVFYMLPARMWELLIGVLTALLLRRYPNMQAGKGVINNAVTLLGLGLLIFGFFQFYETTRIAEKALVICLGAAMVIVTGSGTIAGRLLGSPPFRFVGKISYSLYLWHWPMASLMVMLPVRFPEVNRTAMFWLLFVASFVSAYVSWRFIEKPMRRVGDWGTCLKRLAPVFSILLLLGIGSNQMWFGSDSFSFHHRFFHGLSLLAPGSSDEGMLGDQEAPLSFILLGNSHAQSVSKTIDDLAKAYKVRGVFLWDGVLPYFNMAMVDATPRPGDIQQAFRDYVKKHSIRKLLVIARWDHILEHSSNAKLLYEGELLPKEQAEAVFARELPHFLRMALDLGLEVWIMEQVPRGKVDPTVAVRIDNNYTEPYSLGWHNRVVKDTVSLINSRQLHLLSPESYFVRDGRVHFTSGSSLLYFDADHLSIEGGHLLKPLFVPFFE